MQKLQPSEHSSPHDQFFCLIFVMIYVVFSFDEAFFTPSV